ncbi:unnamed protein product [Caenorhabditis bovis]|uniref:Uncharacterized protein n=1 Tax=Caenorhabditis bovis TaxID=2654633 RepID=A0A8S1EVR0_9PELO|nr:unnamed protein product [Caenorhabditis bovis]
MISILALLAGLAAGQQTFQNTIFDLPAQLGGEPVGVAAQAQGAPLFVQAPDAQKPPPPANAAAAAPAQQPQLPQAPPLATTPAPFTLPTLAPFTLPSHPTLPPFSLPTHPTIAPFTFPTHPPLVFPTPTTPAPFLPPSPYAFVPQSGFPQQGQQAYNGYPQQQYYNQQQQQQYYYPQQFQQQTQQQNGYNQQPQYYNNNNNNNNYYQGQQQPQQQTQQQLNGVQQPLVQPQQPQQPSVSQAQSFEAGAQIVHPIQTIQPHPEQVLPVPQKPVANAVATQVVDTATSSKKANEFNSKAEKEKTATIEKASLDAEIDAKVDRHAWFNPDYDATECRKSLKGIGAKFQKKFPSYLQKGGKDQELSQLVEQRLIECDRKSTASHWDKVDTLLQKISLTKSEEGECRAGLIQERISCVNLLKYACQFVDAAYHFKLVPARLTIQEARQAESGAEKCRQVVRIVKQRLEAGAAVL